MKKENKELKLKELFKEIWNCFECFSSNHESEKNFRKVGVEEPRNFKRSIHLREPFVFPPYTIDEKIIKGFFGTGEVGNNRRVMFVMSRPSTGGPGNKIPDETDKILYRLLEKFDLQESHLTDFIKCRGPGKEHPKDMLKNCVSKFLEKEYEIVNPNTLIALGRDAENWCEDWLGEEPEYITHYAWKKPRNKVEERMEKQLKEIVDREVR